MVAIGVSDLNCLESDGKEEGHKDAISHEKYSETSIHCFCWGSWKVTMDTGKW
jgi:hypothetical protein